MKIALVNPTFLMRRPIAELAKLLAQNGHEVTVVWPMDGKNPQGNQLHFDSLLKDNPNITVLPIWSKEIKAILWSYPTDWRVFSKLYRLGREHEVVQIWAPFYPMPLLPFFMKRLGLFRAKLLGTYDTIPSYSFSMGRITDKAFRLFFALLTKPVLQAATFSTVYSNLLIPHAERAGFSRKRLRVLPTGVHRNVKSRSGDIRQELKIPKDLPVILFIGLINKRKGVYRILEVAEELKKRGCHFKLLMVGKGPEQEEVEAYIQSHDLRNEVQLTGRRQDVHNFYHQASCLFLPAVGEGLPGVVMEALSYGRPVVASDIPCIPDLVQSGKNGFLHDPEDIAGFANSLEKIISDKKLAEKMGKNALSKIGEWDWEKRYLLYEELYKELHKKFSRPQW